METGAGCEQDRSPLPKRSRVDEREERRPQRSISRSPAVEDALLDARAGEVGTLTISASVPHAMFSCCACNHCKTHKLPFCVPFSPFSVYVLLPFRQLQCHTMMERSCLSRKACNGTARVLKHLWTAGAEGAGRDRGWRGCCAAAAD